MELKNITLEGISYPINSGISEYVPDIKNFIEKSIDKSLLKALMASISIDPWIPVLLVGPTGGGKTELIRWLSNKTNHSYRRIQLNGSTNIDSFVGKWLINEQGTYWVDGILTDAMRKGHWLLLDELNAALPEILFVLHSLLDNDRCLILDDKGKEIVKMHPNFRLFAAMNPTEDYTGTKELNRALLDRFTVLKFDYPTKPNEEKIVSAHSGISRTFGSVSGIPVIKRMVEFANIIRKKNESATIVSICSTRQLIHWAKLCQHLDIKHAAEVSIINKCDTDEQTSIRDELNKLFINNESIQSIERVEKQMKEDLKKQEELLALKKQAEVKINPEEIDPIIKAKLIAKSMEFDKIPFTTTIKDKEEINNILDKIVPDNIIPEVKLDGAVTFDEPMPTNLYPEPTRVATEADLPF